MTRTEALAAYYRSRPNEWISVYDLERIAGRWAWRTRSSECARWYDMDIREHCKRHPNGTKEPMRMFVPKPKAEQIGLFGEGDAA